MTGFLITYQPELVVLATTLTFTALAFWLERGFRRRAERQARKQLPEEWRRALDEAWGKRRG